VSLHTRFRGGPAANDGRITLLSVNYNSAPDMLRLIASYQKFVGVDAPLVIVENSDWVRELAQVPNITYVRPPGNLQHGLGLDYGMRKVETEYTLICDPDTAILSSEFAPRMIELAAKRGISGVGSNHDIYHPICVLFRTEWWKHGDFTFVQNWPWWDVAGGLTALHSGRDPETVLKRTRIAGPRLRWPIYLVEVYEDLFTNTHFVSRLNSDEGDDEHIGIPRSLIEPIHRAWRSWVDAVVAGETVPSDFPIEEAELDTRVYDKSPSMMKTP